MSQAGCVELRSEVDDELELVLVTHVEDAITFWAQNVTESQAVEKMDAVLSEICPTTQRMTGKPNFQKLYGACFSRDRCWYRCKVQQQIEDKFHVTYVDYGNAEVVERSNLVELPEDLQSAELAQKYKFWGVYLTNEQDSPHFLQGKSFLHNLICGNKLRINKKNVSPDGTILVQAFQGTLNIGEEVMKLKFANASVPGSKESPPPASVFQSPMGHWTLRSPQGECNKISPLGCMPKLRPVFSNPKEPNTTEPNTTAPNTEGELLEENQQPMSEINVHQMLNKAKSELQEVQEEVKELKLQIEKLENEKRTSQEHANQINEQMNEANRQLKEMTESCQKNKEYIEVHMSSIVGETFLQMAQKVKDLKKIREKSKSSTAEDLLSKSITLVVNNQSVMPFTSDTLEDAWKNYKHTLNSFQDCQSGELEDLIKSRNEASSVLLTVIDDFFLEVDSLSVEKRLQTLKDISTSLMGVFAPVSTKAISNEAIEKFCEWKNQKHQKYRDVRQATDKTLTALSEWAANFSKFFGLVEDRAVPEGNGGLEINELLKQAESDVSKELNLSESEPGGEKIMANALQSLIKQIENEQLLLHSLRKMYDASTKFKQDMDRWQNSTPKADDLFRIKKSIKSLRSQLRWKQMEVGCLEEAEELDLSEIMKKKEEIAETRNALFLEIRHEREEYVKLCELVKGSFPELVHLYPEADLSSYISSEGLLIKSLDRDIFDAEPMRELSGRRPLVCSEYQGQKVVLKGYSVDKDSELRMLEQAAQFHRVQTQNPTSIMPLLGMFFGKSDPLAYVMVPYYPNGSLRAVQKMNPLIPSEIGKVMSGVILGLQILHDSSITHASLNPSNVFVLHREQGIVGDFDYTKTVEQRAVNCGMVAGFISLVAPELGKNQPPSPASDMYAVGGLMLWLHAPDCRGVTMAEPQTLEFIGLQLDAKLKHLLSKLLVGSGRLSAQEALRDDYFLSVEN